MIPAGELHDIAIVSHNALFGELLSLIPHARVSFSIASNYSIKPCQEHFPTMIGSSYLEPKDFRISCASCIPVSEDDLAVIPPLLLSGHTTVIVQISSLRPMTQQEGLRNSYL